MKSLDGTTVESLRLGQFKMVITLITIIFFAIVGYTIVWEVNYKNKYGYFEKTVATVVDKEELDGNYYDVLGYMVNNVEYHKTTLYKSRNDIGDTITIYYDTNNPVGVIYKLDCRRIVLPIISILFGLCDCGLVLLYCIHSKNLKNKQTKK